MSKSGCDIITILDTIIYHSRETVSETFRMVKRNIERGKSLSEAFSMTNKFSIFFISMVRSGEISGNIDYIFEKLSQYYNREYKLKSKLTSASIYPIILIIVFLISFSFILVFVVPKFEILLDNNMDSSIGSKGIFAFSKFLRNHLISIVLVVIFSLYIFYVDLLNNEKIRLYLDSIKFKIPKLREFYKMLLAEKFSQSLSILLGSGVNIGESLDIVASILDNKFLVGKIIKAKEYIELGNGVTSSLEIIDVFPEIFISTMSSGEKAGKFEENLKLMGEYYQEEIDLQLENFIKLVEPVLIVIMGILIGFSLISILSPMFEIISKLG